MRPPSARSLIPALLAVAAAPVLALTVAVQETVKIHESHKYGYFPSVQQLSTGELICDFSLDADIHDVEGNFWAYVISNDGGKTWGLRNTNGFIYRECSYTRDPALPDGSMLIVAGYPLPSPGNDYRTIHASSVRLSEGGKTVLLRRDVEISLPRAAARQKMTDEIENFASLGPGKIKEAALMLFSGTTVAARDGGWLALMYGRLEGDEFFRTIVVRADREGKKWSYVATVAGDAEARASLAREGETRTEGFAEPRMIRLRDGRLFMVLRRGSNNQMYKSWSSDDGRTWTPPVSLGFKGVEPAMMEMQSGLLVVSTGRPGPIGLHFSADGGETWSERTVVADFTAPTRNSSKAIFSQHSTCYTGLVETEPGRLLVVYDHLPHVEGWGLNPADKPEAMNSIYGTFVSVRR